MCGDHALHPRLHRAVVRETFGSRGDTTRKFDPTCGAVVLLEIDGYQRRLDLSLLKANPPPLRKLDCSLRPLKHSRRGRQSCAILGIEDDSPAEDDLVFLEVEDGALSTPEGGAGNEPHFRVGGKSS